MRYVWHWPSKLDLRKQFVRFGKKTRHSNTSEYFHDKIILADRITIANKIIDYLIDDILDLQLRDQA